ncbi:3'-5' exonuclease [Undibacterium terreum]|uniref:Ribonuclease D n=1 Tax=Undibacterium terreum TaxID=1224302 RepID=A0A916U4G3_9BURK|nr:3'-5' exonuclease [Undibacterium terreum]GGC58992.1 ribonuclease D [Undibacterium terreum]
MSIETSTEASLPPYPGIQPQDVLVVTSAADMERACKLLEQADIVGFDTESKPTFLKGQDSGGPHLIQLATDTKAFLFPVLRISDLSAVKAILESKTILKVGFGLSEDTRRLRSRLGIEVAGVLDLSKTMREHKRNDMGAKTAVAKYFGMKLQKSKKTSTSNWAAADLSERQIKYAADDAQVALLVYRIWLSLPKPQEMPLKAPTSDLP